MKTPRQLGFTMPAEWEPHEATWLAWPKDPETFPANIIHGVEAIYVKMIKALSRGEKIYVLADKKNHARINRALRRAQVVMKNVYLVSIAYVDVWMRDFGPTFLVNRKQRKLACVKWIFNAWGNKWRELLPDDKAGKKVATLVKPMQKNMKIFVPGIVMEGGSIEVNGAGAVLVTEQCQLNKNRNPHLSRARVEKFLREYLNVQTVVWLKEGIAGDDTDGHIDDIARFVNEKTIFCAYENDRRDENHKILARNWDILAQTRAFKLVKLPMPRPKLAKTIAPAAPGMDPNRRLAASYSNFYIGNACVLVPLYDKKYDKKVLALFKKYFPGRKIVGIPATKLVFGYGSFHCVTQQQPRI